MRALLVLSLLLLSAHTAHADEYFETGSGLYAKCTGNSAADLAYCLGYTAAIADGMQHENAVAARCITGQFPADVTKQQVRDVVLDYLASDREIRKQPAQFLVYLALVSTFPCPK